MSIKKACILLLFPVLLVDNKVTVVNFEQLQTYAEHKTNDTLYVVNFWATWCDPCVKELPSFQEIQKKYSGKKMKMILVSMNSAKELTKVQDYTDNHKLGPMVVLLSGSDPNVWINKVDSSWSGAIPATVMYKSGKKVYFREGDFTSESLDKAIKSKIK